jgi:Protein of unknown function (DUF4232)
MAVRRLVAVALVLAAAVAVTTSAAGTASACRAAHLRGHLYDENGAAGTILLSVTLTNKGAACTLKGYARLQLMASARRTLPTHVVHGGLQLLNQKPKTVRLAHNGAATILIAYSDVVHQGETRCPSGTEILVRVPGDLTWIPVLAGTSACAHGALEESPILSGKRKAG